MMRSAPQFLIVILFVGMMMTSSELGAQEQEDTQPVKGYPNLPTPTLGGRQFWTDHQWNDGWRIQQNAITGHWRLLSPNRIRHAWGSRAACDAALASRIDAQRQPDERVVVLIHGLMRSSQSMEPVGRALRDSGVGRPVTFGYASTRRGIAEHAAALREWIETLPGRPKIDFVCHSMGNIVVRHALADWEREGDPHGVLDRIGCFVMLGPPNQGAEIARKLSRLGLFEIVTGQGGMELGPAWDEFQQRLATPSCPFAIIAGDMSEGWLKNPVLGSEASDFVVRLEETRLDGCAEFHTVPVLHSLLMNDAAVQEIVRDFLHRHAD